MKGYLRNAGFLLSLALPASTLADPFPSAVDAGSAASELRIRSDESPMMMTDAMNRLQKYDTILSLVKRSFAEMGDSNTQHFKRQITTDPKTGNAGSSNFDVAAWDKQVNDACAMPIEMLSGTITTITDPAGVAVCYNIPYYNVTTGVFESDIRLYKIANGTQDWEAAGTKISLSVQYQGAQVQLAEAPDEEGEDIVVSDTVANAMVMNPHTPPNVGNAAAALDKGAKAAAAAKKVEFLEFLSAEEAAKKKKDAAAKKKEAADKAAKLKGQMPPPPKASAAKPSSTPSSTAKPSVVAAANAVKPSSPAASAAKPASSAKPAAGGPAAKAVAAKKASGAKSSSAKPSSTPKPAKAAAPAAKAVAGAKKPASSAKPSSAAKTSSAKPSSTKAASASPSAAASKNNKREVHMMQAIKAEPQKPGSFTPHLLQTLRFVGTVNKDVMANETIRKDPAIMKLVLTPSLMLVGGSANGGLMNASVAAAQVQYVTGAFSNITSPVPPAEPFVLPGTFIAIFPLGLYLISAYTGLFVIIVGAGTVERYLFRMSFRKRSAMLNGQDGFGKI
ncbi:hypothetical protein TWF696_006764 [Orbilia brochopaga]|uniref:Uncharacterized protein n=1 Tax=Orbilia brochopaga TaxID=3140254 RepID=A0AAV9UQY5_9PEZI